MDDWLTLWYETELANIPMELFPVNLPTFYRAVYCHSAASAPDKPILVLPHDTASLTESKG